MTDDTPAWVMTNRELAHRLMTANNDVWKLKWDLQNADDPKVQHFTADQQRVLLTVIEQRIDAVAEALLSRQ